MRPQEWIKNLLVFAGLLFSAEVQRTAQVVDATVTFAAFCASRAPATCSTTSATSPRTASTREAPPPDRQRASSRSSTAIGAAVVLAVVALGDRGARGSRGGRRAGRWLYGVITVAYSVSPQAPGDPRRDDDRLAVHRSGWSRAPSRSRRTPRSTCCSARGCSPSSSASPSAARRRSSERARRRTRSRPGPRALLAPVPRPDGRDGHRGGDHQLRDLRGQLAR